MGPACGRVGVGERERKRNQHFEVKTGFCEDGVSTAMSDERKITQVRNDPNEC